MTPLRNDWPIVRLGDLLAIEHGFAFKGEHFADHGEYVIVTPGNFHAGGGFKHKNEGREKYYTVEPPSDFILGEGNLILALTDLTQDAPILGSPAKVPAVGSYLHNQRIGKVVLLDEARVDLDFIYYIFCMENTRAKIRATATGATVRHTAPKRIYEIEVPLPPLGAQRRIGRLLSSYDDLIEYNERRIRVLEEILRAIHREWFVDFRFPGHESTSLVDSDLGPIPSGWRWARLQELTDEVRKSVDPASVDSETPYFGLEHLPQRSMAIESWGAARDAGSRKYLFEPGDILFGKIRPYLHKVGIPPVSGICSTDAIVIRPRDDIAAGLVLAVVASDAFVAHAVQTSQGTQMPRANWKVLERYLVPIPGDDLLVRFSSHVADTMALIHALLLVNRNLLATRDLLMPRLVSGELDVSDLDIEEGVLVA